MRDDLERLRDMLDAISQIEKYSILINPEDNWHKQVIQMSQSLNQTRLMTTEKILEGW